ncbi:peptidoglycan-binding domain-containing protein [Thermoanaerobacter kivui]|uniref:Peptidoglycan-binding domain-containing protein n=1 Tax=Thermoanaerobacter kivui TaxID=2325 RepID=A0A097AUT7_THEKI|nr:peptidoglycan-binding domain-containing protein [Thermoanaerobacter kivui]
MGYTTGGVDGIFGKNTDAAIRAFQKANGLTPDGIIGPKTLQALTKAANSISSASATPKSNTAAATVKPVTLSSGSTTPVQQKSSSTYQTPQNTTNTKTASTSYVIQTSTNKSYSGSTTPVPSNPVTSNTVASNKTYSNSASTVPALNGSSTAKSVPVNTATISAGNGTAVYKSASASPSVIPTGGSNTPSSAKNNAVITAYTAYSKSGSTTPVQTNGRLYPSYLKSGSVTPYRSASTTPITYSKNGSTTPIAGGSTTPRINILAGQINGSTTPQNYKVYNKNGQITTNQQNVNTVTVLKNFGEGIGDAVVDTLKGVWTIATHPVETAQGIAYAATHPVETANAIKEEAIKTYNDFKTGDANTKSKIAGRIVGEVGLAVVGTKGIDKGIKAVKEATVIAGTAKTAETAVDITKAGKAAGVAEKVVEKISKAVPKIESTSVKETAISPSKLAQMAQGTKDYPGIDRFRDIT